jgi:radical SAM superfamily enzyme YgiQ (UPF0313 family)
MADDENLLQMMKDVDFRFVFIGIETPEDEILKLTNKKINVNRSVQRSVEKIFSYGMIVNAGFIIGFDTETERTAASMIRFIQNLGICMAMVGKLYALPKTQLTRRLEREGRLFESGSTLSDPNTDLDQLTSGLNFITSRSRVDVLKDYSHVISYLYDPQHYYERVIRTSLSLRTQYKHRPGIGRLLKNIKAFLKVCRIAGFNKTTGWLYWKALLTVTLKNPRAIEATVNLAAMFIHFHKQSQFIIELTNREIADIERNGTDEYDQLIMQNNKRNLPEVAY